MDHQPLSEFAEPFGNVFEASTQPSSPSVFHHPSLNPQPAAASFNVSGRYEGEMSSPTNGLDLLDLRLDIDERYTNSPVMGQVSGDFYQFNKITVPGSPPHVSRVYRESWIVNHPDVTRLADRVLITGTVSFWKGIHPPTTLNVTIMVGQVGVTPSAQVSFARPGGQPSVYNCLKKSDCFRDLDLEIDVCDSVNFAPLLPSIETVAHAIRPAGVPARILTIEEAYREAGVAVTIPPLPSVIDDSDPGFGTWSAAELHDVMETYFSHVSGPWPQWSLWGVLASRFDEPGVGGVMFDAAAAFGGAGSAVERQGFAVFRDHAWFNDLTSTPPTNQDEATAARQFLYTWVHEAGHAFNFLHSWNKNRPDSLSWMNYDWRYDNLHGADSFWSNFSFRFDDEELIHLRHGDRSSVIMGGDPWASGGHLEAPPGAEYLAAPPGAMSSLDGAAPLELLIRSKGYFEFMEPVSIELRIRNLFPDLSLTLDTRLSPEYGGVVIYIRRPDGRIVEYSPVMCKLAAPSPRTLLPLQPGVETGQDRYSEEVPLSYGRYGFYFDEPGEYFIRALYQGAGDLLIPSDVHRLRVGNPLTKDLDVTAQDYFSYEVGMNLYLEGSRSVYLEKGLTLLTDMSNKYKDSLLGAKIATTVANSLTKSFHSIKGGRGLDRSTESLKLTKSHDADPQAALGITEPAVELMRKRKQKSLNLSYRQIVGQRVDCLMALQRPDQASQELHQLHDDLKTTGANAPVLRQIDTLADQIQSTREQQQPNKLWERVRAQDEIVFSEPLQLDASGGKSKQARKATSKKKSKSRS
ncbi:MAG: hypothetical protein ACXW3F_08185 [Pyrinomonadaceae bacterium]